ncbi:conjugal transfer protein TraB [Acidithiobacillus thiooxidans]|uniref:Conjugal transfer protein TraB n=2 Tax=Acidithiobacillaceae TaxID=225058 RepID=A0A1C2IAA5_ACITH|nr:conjugal transfer protein TraB [Acidithiobacillus thiooxidans]OCX72915.1 conjugal transfer protein TraB [Acidithiobacillus thiooxidans]OCX73994.1 conjugal transfer protein TraB [Acidithiobacillus thiooxidans]OCX81123.1 conjugal transfer protein TraB [Acidithiobacillus thiooxidans]OCX82589.1 conjugal transfer protein TraB [Acidithiobacillus thiooxidans]
MTERALNLKRVFSYLLLGSIVGFSAWPHAICLAPFALLLLPVVNRRYWLAPFLVMLGYHLATTNGLIHGTDVIFPHAGLWLGIGFWMGSSCLFALPYLAYPYLYLFFRGGGRGALAATMITSIFSTIIPPLGIIGWTSPWIGALPTGWGGILVVLMLIYGLGRWEENKMTAFLVAAMCLSAYLWSPFVWGVWGVPVRPASPALPAGWVSIHTDYGELSNLSYVTTSLRLVPRVLRDLESGDRVVLLPEGIAGPWLTGTRAIWQPVLQYTAKHPSTTVLLGADVLSGRQKYVDALIQMHDGREKILPDRIPVPFSMWHPWAPRNSFRMHVFGNPELATVDGVRVGYLICYEQLLVWPALGLWHSGVQVLLAPADVWWARGTSIPAIQRVSVDAWARFLGVPVLRAVNL